MMRKLPLILLGAAAGAALTFLATQPRIGVMGASARAAGADTYRQLNLFGDVFERVRADYVEKPELSLRERYRWAVLDTFDMFSPVHDHPQSAETLRSWMAEAGLAEAEVLRLGHLVARGAKP